MKTVGTILATAFVLMPWCISPLFSQQNNTGKSIVITKRSVDADSSEVVETIIKKGKAAENFNVEEYIRNNRSDKVQLDVRVEDGDAEKNIVVKCEPKQARGFLGVTGEDDNNKEPGVAVSITPRSAAEKAGLEHGDVIFSLNDTPIMDFKDISDFMDATQPGHKVQVTYEREGKRNTVEATLGEHKSWDWEAWSQNWADELDKKNWNWDNYDVNVREKPACLGVYTDAATLNDKSGAQISSFTDESAAREVQMAEGDLILSVNGQRVQGHDDLWKEIAKYQPKDKIQVEYLREGKTLQVEAALKACRDNSSRVEIRETDEGGDKTSREFLTWNWENDDQKRMQERRVITIHRGEGDAPEILSQAPPSEPAAAGDRKLNLESFRAFPNPTGAQVTITFKAEPVATTVALFDAAGRQLFREEMNAFSGEYFQQFDLTEYAKGTVVIRVQQGDKVYSEQIIVN